MTLTYLQLQMTIYYPFPSATDSHLLLGEAAEGIGVRSGQFLKAAAISTKSAVQMMKLMQRQIEVTMFAAGAAKLGDLKNGKLSEKS